MAIGAEIEEVSLEEYFPQDVAAFEVHAHLLGERLNVKHLDRSGYISDQPLTRSFQRGGVVVLFRFGVAVFFGVSDEDQASFIQSIAPTVREPIDTVEIESETVNINPSRREGADPKGIYLSRITLERLQLIAQVLAKSVVLEFYELEVDKNFDLIEPIAKRLKEGGQGRRGAKEVLRHIGGLMLSEHKMVGRVEIDEKPDILWDHHKLERFYHTLAEEWELKDRHLALERKLQVLSRTTETALDLLHNIHSLRVEWYIVILIVMEVLLTLYDLFIR